MIATIEIFSTKQVVNTSVDVATEMIINGRARLVQLNECEWSTGRQTTDEQGHKVIEIKCIDSMNMLD